MSQLCNNKFKTDFVYISNTEYIHIDKFKSDYINKNYELKCINGHELIYVEGEKMRSYFRHKNINDTINRPITEWHAE
jgi:hypothetical protein